MKEPVYSWRKNGKVIYYEHGVHHHVAESRSKEYFVLRKNIPALAVFYSTIKDLEKAMIKIGESHD